MERESFEDDEVANILNRYFISIKVDREERPDIDSIYMSVCQALTGHGGWPLTIFMDSEKRPFYAGTYFPKNNRMGMPGLISVLGSIINAWEKDRELLQKSGEQITDAIRRSSEIRDTNATNHYLKSDNQSDLTNATNHYMKADSQSDLTNATNHYMKDDNQSDLINAAYTHFYNEFDSIFGGFGNAPKFPSPHNLYFLLRYWYSKGEKAALEMVEKTLDSMYRGGIYDHIGFGFCRYSTDRKWLIPHFEKMLYDNALLAVAYLEAFQATRRIKYADIAKEIFTYIKRDMTSPEGAFYSAEDADSEGVEGKFYSWTVEEVIQTLGEDRGHRFCRYFGITQVGNFEGHSIPNLLKGEIPDSEKAFAEECKKQLFEFREKRIHPYKDDKILTSWNGLMIYALAAGGRVLGETALIESAEKAAAFIMVNLIREDGRLLARYRAGEAAIHAFVDDYAFLVWGLTELYEATYKPMYLENALKLNDNLIKLFWNEKSGGLFLYGSDSEQLLIRPMEIYDGAIPSGNSVSAMNFLRLSKLTGRYDLEEKFQVMLRLFTKDILLAPGGCSYFLSAAMFAGTSSREIILVCGQEADSGNLEQFELLEKFVQPKKLEKQVQLEQPDKLEQQVQLEQPDKLEQQVQLEQPDKLEQQVQLEQPDKLEQQVQLEQPDKLEQQVQLEQMLKVINEPYRPFTISVVYGDNYKELDSIMPYIKNYKAIEGKTTAYVCENFSCKAPITDISELIKWQ